METRRTMRLNQAIAIILVILGLVLMVVGANLTITQRQSAVFDWGLIVASIGTSVTAAGVVFIVQIFFLGDPTSRVEIQLQQVLIRRLPQGVARVFLRVDEAPPLDEVMRDCKKITFFGPGGAQVLSIAADEAMRRGKGQCMTVEMFLAENQDEVADNLFRPDFKQYSEWNKAVSKSKVATAQGKLKLRLYRIPIEPTVSALQVDDSYYQVTMLFPIVQNLKRPTLALEKSIAKEEYFTPLWNYLRAQVDQE